MDYTMDTTEQEDALFAPYINYAADQSQDWDDSNFTMFEPAPINVLHTSASQLNAPPPAVLESKVGQIRQGSTITEGDAKFQPRGSTTSSSSPESSSQDSSSESSGQRKRKSTNSTLFSHGHARTRNGAPVGTYSSGMHSTYEEQSPVLSTETDVDIMSRDINHVNLFSRRNSPGISGQAQASQTIAPSKIEKSFATTTDRKSQFMLGGDSRDASPTMTLSNGASPADLHNSSSPNAVYNSNTFSTSNADRSWHADAVGSSAISPSSTYVSVSSPLTSASDWSAKAGVRFTARPLQSKSRVETQIAIRLVMAPLPPTITKLHLPRESISKSKNFAKEVARSPDTLELHTSVVCASAMTKPGVKERALRRAAAAASGSKIKDETTGRRSSSNNMSEDDPHDPSEPLNGGEVQICENCVARERKRAARKRIKKQEDEETWTKFERERIVVFNEKEYKDWQPPKESSPEQQKLPKGTMIIEVPMRIACYCRHQGEKLGFQVIFTLTDYEDKLIAQSMTTPVLITDDHKTHTQPTAPSSASATTHASDMQPQPGLYQRPYHSTNDLQGLQNALQPQFFPNGQPYHSHSALPSGTTSATMTPRNMSRQASPSAQMGANKRRKGSGSGSHHHRLPSGLTMTPRIDTQAMPGAVFHSTAPSSATTPGFAPHGFVSQGDASFATGLPLMSPMDHAPTTPGVSGLPSARNQSNENLQHFYSVPNSAHQSRSGSPINPNRNSMHGFHSQQQQQLQQPLNFGNTVAPTITSMQAAMDLPQSAPPPTYAIRKILPTEGPTVGGIEVTCLGSGFTRDLEVMFGDIPAINTNWWSESTLVAMLPPAPRPGPVAVTVMVRNSRSFTPPQHPAISQVLFTYRDETVNDQLFQLALQIMHQQQGGNINAFRDLLINMANQTASNQGSTGMGGGYVGGPPPGQTGFQQMHGPPLSAGVVNEETMLKCLDFLDLDESPEPPQYNKRTPTGATMMSLACALGYTRFVAALLARGADPETRDIGGFTPLMMASLRGHPQIVRRLLLRGADSMTRSLRGYQAIDMTASQDVISALQRMPQHQRSRSAGDSLSRSRRNSIASLHSIWETPSNSSIAETFEDSDDSDASSATDGPVRSRAWVQSRRNSTIIDGAATSAAPPPPSDEHHGFLHPASAAAAFNQMSAQLQHIQQTFQRTFPNIQFPALPAMPNMPTMPTLEGYQATGMVRRISSMVPHTTNPRAEGNGSDKSIGGSALSSWSMRDLFSSSPSPPAYEEIYPVPAHKAVCSDGKDDAILRAEADHFLDRKCQTLFDEPATTSGEPAHRATSSTAVTEVEDGKSDSEIIDIRYGSRKPPSKEHQQRVQAALRRKRRPLWQDWHLWFFWLPIAICFFFWTPLVKTLMQSPITARLLPQGARVVEEIP